MTVIDFIENFIPYEIGNFVVYDGKQIFQIIDVPKFAIYDSDGLVGYSPDHVTDLKTIHYISGRIPVGYRVAYVDADNEISDQTHHLCAIYELYDAEKHAHLIHQMTKFQKLLEIERLKDEIDELDEL